jgi:hypothetical protein
LARKAPPQYGAFCASALADTFSETQMAYIARGLMRNELDLPDSGDPDEVIDASTGATRRHILTAAVIFGALMGVQSLGPLTAANAAPVWNYPFTQRYRVTGYWHEPRPLTGTEHQGLDFGAPSGAAIYSVASGTVTRNVNVSQAGTYGNWVLIDHGSGLSSLYAHMRDQSRLVVGEYVAAGQYIGPVGGTGGKYDPHLHLELKTGPRTEDTIDPYPLIVNAPLAGDNMAISDADATKITQSLRSAVWFTGAPGKPTETKTVEQIYQGILQTVIGYGARTENIEGMVTNLGTRLASDRAFIDAIATATAAKLR